MQEILTERIREKKGIHRSDNKRTTFGKQKYERDLDKSLLTRPRELRDPSPFTTRRRPDPPSIIP